MIKYIIRNHTKNCDLKLISALGKKNFGKSITKLTTKKIGAVFNFKRGQGLSAKEYSAKRIMIDGKIVKHVRSKKKAARILFNLKICLRKSN